MRRLDPGEDLLRVTRIRMRRVHRTRGQRITGEPEHCAQDQQTIRHRQRLAVAVGVKLALRQQVGELGFDLVVAATRIGADGAVGEGGRMLNSHCRNTRQKCSSKTKR